MGQHQPAQNKEEIDPEVAVLDELGVAGDRLHPLGKSSKRAWNSTTIRAAMPRSGVNSGND
jgi:hypothetical protein